MCAETVHISAIFIRISKVYDSLFNRDAAHAARFMDEG